jgi:hypothetical protein
MHRRSVIAVAMLGLLAAACGSSGSGNASPTTSPSATSPSPSAVAGPIDPCTLVTLDEAAALAKTQLTKIPTSGANAANTCEYVSATRTSEVLVGYKIYADAATARSAYQVAAQQMVQKGVAPVDVTGVGDAATLFHNGTILSAIAFAKGSYGVVIVVHPAPSDGALQAAGFTAASRLP